jgi:hypothetical protein
MTSKKSNTLFSAVSLSQPRSSIRLVGVEQAARVWREYFSLWLRQLAEDVGISATMLSEHRELQEGSVHTPAAIARTLRAKSP